MNISSVSDYALSQCRDRADGRVHSVFSSSFNVDLDGFLLHVGTDAAPLSCLGGAVATEEMDRLLARAHPGDRVHVRQGVLRVYSGSGVSELALGAAPVRAMAVRPAASGALADADVHLYGALAACRLVERTGFPWPDSSPAIESLARFSIACLCMREEGEDSARHMSYEAAVRAVRGAVSYLVGRGLGLTPSGDDALTGFGTALHFLHGDAGEPWCRPFYEAVSALCPGRTTAVAEAYLMAMVDGYANEDYLDLLEVVSSRAWSEVPSCLERILAMGHTSGADGLLGFAAAFGCLF